MNSEYFKEHIEEELEGALDYIKQAIEIKPMNSSWAKDFAEMSKNELEHASGIYEKYGEYYGKLAKSYDMVPDCISEMWHDTATMYAELSAKVLHMHEMFNG